MNKLVKSISIIGVLCVFGFFLMAALLNYYSQSNLQHSKELVIKSSNLLIQQQRLKTLTKQLDISKLHANILVLAGYFLIAGTLIFIGRVVARRDREIALLNIQYDTTQILADSLDANASIKKVLGMICKNLGWGFGAFWSIKDNNDLKCITLWRDPTFGASEFVSLTRSTILPVGCELPGRTFQLQQPLWVEDTSDLSARVSAAAKGEINTGLGIPITLGNNKLGVVEFFSKDKKKPDKEIIRFMVALSSQIAQSIERQQAQQALVDHEVTLSTILDTAAEGIFSVSSDGRIESANDAACKIFDYELGSLTGQKIKVILPEFLDITSNTLKENENGVGITKRACGTDIEIIGIRNNGSELPAAVSYSITTLRNKKIITGIIRDTTDKKERERRVSEFYSTVSHELRTPLTSIRGSLSLIDGGRAGALTPRAQQLIKVARFESERLVRLINDILDIKKIESGKLELNLEQIEVAELVQQALEGLYGYAALTGIKLASQLDTTGIIYCDRDRIEQLLNNLISNAIKFSPSGEEVIVTVDKARSGAWRFSVKDRGPGISEKEMPKLFRLFQQLDPSDSRRKEGTGLGLAICKALAEKHNGSIGVESSVGQGSTFWFEVPNIKIPCLRTGVIRNG